MVLGPPLPKTFQLIRLDCQPFESTPKDYDRTSAQSTLRCNGDWRPNHAPAFWPCTQNASPSAPATFLAPLLSRPAFHHIPLLLCSSGYLPRNRAHTLGHPGTRVFAYIPAPTHHCPTPVHLRTYLNRCAHLRARSHSLAHAENSL